MRIIKNFLHNINDIVLAFVIVALAAGIIYWRMGIILDYPKQIAAQNAVYLQNDDKTADEDADAEAADNGDTGEAEDAADSEATEDEAADAKG